MNFSSQNLLVLARGPFLLISVLLAIVIPHLQQLSTSTLLACGVLVVGCFVTIRDVLWVTQTNLRSSIQQTLDNTVLDNLLRSIFDPETGWISCMIGMVMGNALMYTLPMNASQRVQLLQSTLGVDESDAQEILQSPGGIKHILPEAVQNWLGPTTPSTLCDDKDDATCSTNSSGQESEHQRNGDDAATNRSPRPASPHELSHVELFGESSTAAPICRTTSTSSTQEPRRSQIPTATDSPPLPVTVLSHILREMAGERIYQFAESVPKSALLAVGVSSTIGLLVHLTRNARARRQVGVVVEGLTTLSLSSLVIASSAALFAKSSFSVAQRPDTEERLALSRQLLRFVDRRRWQCFFAFLVMFIVRQRTKASNRRLYNR